MVKKSESEKVCKRTSIGGQAVMEGVMMRGGTSVATAVRAPSGDITLETFRTKPKSKIEKLPFVRGVISFVSSLFTGTKIIMRTAEVYGDFSEPSKTEIWMEKKLHVNAMDIVLAVSVVLGLALAVFLFTVIPSLIVSALDAIPSFAALPQNEVIKSVLQGVLKLIIFVLYIFGVSFVKDIRRLFMYHGAEHKTISCFEHGLELTVENARPMRTEHSRCGTSFMFYVMAISILVLSVVSWLVFGLGGLYIENKALKVLFRIAMSLATIPFVAGISYELLKIFAKSDNLFCRICRAPGLLLQKLTTKEPDDSMLEVAIAAFKQVQAMEADKSLPNLKFDIKVPYAFARHSVERYLGEGCEPAVADWILVEITGRKRGELAEAKPLTSEQSDRAVALAKQCATGKPLQYVLGYSEFYGLKLNVNGAVLVPRPETELLAEQVVKLAQGKKVLDLCTGSGAIALAVAANTDAVVTATDISHDALTVAKANAELNGCSVEFLQGDLFAPLKNRTFDIIVSNPPYIPTADIDKLESTVKDFEPRAALDGGTDGLDFYRRISAEFSAYLGTGGLLALELGAGQLAAVKELFADFRTEVVKDYADIDRILLVSVD